MTTAIDVRHDTDHHLHGGDACLFVNGACRECGVGLAVCDLCDGTGYHRDGCREADEPAPLVADDAEDSGRAICFLALLLIVCGVCWAVWAAAT